MTDQLLRWRRDDDIPDRGIPGSEPFARVVDRANHPANSSELCMSQRIRLERKPAGYELDRLAPLRVSAEDGRDIDPGPPDDLHEVMDARSRRSPRLPHRVTDSDDGTADVTSGELLLFHHSTLRFGSYRGHPDIRVL